MFDLIPALPTVAGWSVWRNVRHATFVSLLLVTPLLVPDGQNRVVCNEQNPGCTVVPNSLHRQLETQSSVVSVVVRYLKPYSIARLTVWNTTSGELQTIDPSKVVLTLNKKRIARQDEAGIAQSFRRGAQGKVFWISLMHALSEPGNETPTRTHHDPVSGTVTIDTKSGTVDGRFSGTVTHTEVDYEALRRREQERLRLRQQAKERVEALRRLAQERTLAISQTMLKPGSVAPGQSITGDVYFKEKLNGKAFSIELQVDAQVVEFPFSKLKKR